MVELFTNGQLAIVMANNASIPDNYGIDAGYVYFLSLDGTGLATSFGPGQRGYVSCSYPRINTGGELI